MVKLEKDKVSQAEANKRWSQKNKDHSNYLKSRTAARSFIRNKATLEDLEELEQLIEQRKKDLSSEVNPKC